MRRLTGLPAKAKQSPHEDELIVAGDALSFRTYGKSPTVLYAASVIAIWYDHNPFGWNHANHWRLVYSTDSGRNSLDIYDSQHSYEPLLLWLQGNFPEPVAAKYRQLWGSPGGDDPSILIWERNGRGA